MKIFLVPALLVLFAACNGGGASPDAIKKALKDDPTILAEAIKANPVPFMDAVREAAQEAQAGEAKRRQEAEAKKLEESYNNPLVPNLRDDENWRGPKDAPITLVEYSDFECPFCSRALQTVNQLMDKYKGKIRFTYKHLPLSFHPNAMGAALYYEAIRLQSGEKAWEFHDELLTNLQKVKNGDKYFKAVAKKLGANMSKLEKDVKSQAVKDRVEADIAEAEKFGFRGTPGFLLNGVPVKGAYPAAHFEGIIDELKKRGKLSI